MSESFKKICRLAGTAIKDHGMIRQKDHILVGLSGGKDSNVLLKVLKHLQAAAPVSFTITGVTFDPMFEGFEADSTAEFCKQLGISHHMIRFDIASLLEEKKLAEKPCMLCSRMRRGNLYSLARKLGANKLALGQHLDDICISFLMSLCRGNGLSTMGPNVPAQSGDLRVIRPLCYVPESLIAEYAATLELPPAGECKYKELIRQEGDRPYFADLLRQLSARIPDLRSNMLRSLSNVQAPFLLDRKYTDTGTEKNEDL
ncbi:MAG: hypothetical protein IKA79_00235 [Lentisphaeria bacterium]|nr:hypothetical protein [Lentisphaeria bacterium]